MRIFFTLILFLFAGSLAGISAQCEYSIVLYDTFGDGWNEGTVSLDVNSSPVLSDLTIESGYDSEIHYFTIQEGDLVTISYNQGQYGYENEIRVYDSEGILTYSDGLNETVPAGGEFTATCPTCFAATNFTVSNINLNDVTLSWEQSETVESWRIEYGPSGFTTGEGTVISDIQQSPYVLSNLEDDTDYDVYLQTQCSVDDQSKGRKQSFTTIPSCYSPEVSSISNITPESAEINLVENGNATEWEIEISETPSGFTGTPTHTGISSPTYNLTGLSPYTDYFVKARSVCSDSDNSRWTDYTSFLTQPTCDIPSTISASNITTEGADIDWTENGSATEWEIEVCEASSWFSGEPTYTGIINQNYTITGLAPYTNYYIRVRSVCSADDSSPWSNYLYFRTLASCSPPSIYSVSNITSETAEVSWTENGTASEWEVELSETSDGFTGVPTYTGITTQSFSLEGLSPNTEYFLKVRSVCSADDSSPWSFYKYFRTFRTCSSPTITAVSNIKSESAELSWNENGTANEWEIEISEASDGFTGVPTYSGVTNTTGQLASLTPNTTYFVKVRSVCSETDYTPWSDHYEFKTLKTAQENPIPCGIDEPISSNNCIEVPISITDQGILGTDIALSEVRLIAEHTYVSDLEISLISPSNVSVLLSHNNGGSGVNFGDPTTCDTYTAFSMTGIDGNISAGSAPFIGSYIPDGDFNDFNDGTTDSHGEWILKICDTESYDEGKLVFAELLFESLVSTAVRPEVLNKMTIEVSPNPASDFINVKINNADMNNDVNLKLYNSAGQIVYQKNLKTDKQTLTDTINSGSLKPGVYFLSVENGADVKTLKVMVTRN